MGLELRWVRYGADASAALEAAVDGAKHGEPLAPVTVVVPSNYVGVASRRALARRPNGVAAVTFLTIYRLAELLGAPLLAGAGRRPVSNPVLAAAVRHALTAKPGSFAPVASHPATEAALVAAYAELREVTADGLDAVARCGRRANDVVRLHRAARRHLEGAWYDEQDLVDAAVSSISEGAPALAALGRVIVHLPQRVTARGSALLRALASTTDITVLAGVTGDERADDDVVRAVSALLEIADPPFASSPHDIVAPDRTRVLSASDADDEVRAAVRAIVAAITEGTPLERIAVLHASPEPYARLVHERLEAADVRSNGAAVVPLAARALGRTLLAALALPDHRYRRDDLLGLLETPVLHRGRLAPSHRWEEISRDAAVVAGRDDWDHLLEAHAATLDAEADENEGDEEWGWLAERSRRVAEQTRALRDFALGLIDDLERSAARPRPWSEHAAWATRLVERLVGNEQRRQQWPLVEKEAADKVMRALDTLGGLDSVEGEVPLEVFRHTLELELDRDLGRVGRFGEGVLVGPIGMGIGLDLDLVVVVGLAEGTFPATVTEDGLLPDDERAAAGGGLTLRRDRVQREHRELLAALAGARRHLLCLPRGDLRRSAERVASRWLLDLAGAMAGERLWSDGLHRLDEPWVDHVPSFAGGITHLALPADEHEHRLRTLTDETAVRPLADTSTVAVDTALRAGVDALAGRRSRAFTRFDGNLRDPRIGAALTLPSPIDGAVSPTRLQTWAKCPHSYFLHYVLRADPIERPEESLTLRPTDKGTLVHAVLDRFISEVLDRPASEWPGPDDPWSPADRARLLAIAEEECDAAESRGLTGRDIFWRRDRPRLLAEIARFLDADDEHRRSHRTHPVATELQFRDVELPVFRDDTLRFLGAADRIDLDEHGTLHIVDYKTGKVEDAHATLGPDAPDGRGVLLQLPVYGAAARAHLNMPDARVVAEYWFVSDRGDFERIGYEVTDEVLERVSRTLRTIVDGIASGVFPNHPTNETTLPWVACAYCDPDGMGVAERRREWERKRSDPALALFADLAEPLLEDEDADA